MNTPDLGRVGLWTTALDELPLAATLELVAELDSQGWGALWFGEALGREAFTAAQLYLGASSRMAIATGIANIYGRDAMAAQAAARTLSAAYPGRFLLGLGVSHVPLVERMRGHSYGRPIAAMREYLDAMDAAPYSVGGEEPAAPRVLAALGPKMLELARDRSAGAHPYLGTPEHTAQARAILGPDAILAVEQGVVVGDDLEEWSSRAHRHLEVYTALPNYCNNWFRLGFTEADVVTGGSDRLAQALVTRGVAAAQQRVQEHLDAGASHVCVQLLTPALGSSPEALTEAQRDWRTLAAALL